MKKKIGTVMDGDLMRLAKRRASEQGVPLSDLIQVALENYLNGAAREPKERLEACRRFCSRPIRLNARQVTMILEADAWE
jgi:hypothetical protein